MKLVNTNQTGIVITEKSLKRTGNQKGVIREESETEVVGPFSLDPVHAVVGATVATTLARNYHSVHIGVTIQIPVPATPEGLKNGVAYCFDKADKVMQKHLKGASEALDELASSRR